MQNNPGTLTASERAYAQNEESLRDARSEAIKQRVAFSQPRSDLDVPRSARFQQLEREYGVQRYSTIGGYTPVRHPGVTISPTRFEDSAAGIAQQLALSGGRIGSSTAAIARSQGYTGKLNVSQYSGRDTVPIRGTRTEFTQREKEFVDIAMRGLADATRMFPKVQEYAKSLELPAPFKSTTQMPGGFGASEPDIFSTVGGTIWGAGSAFGSGVRSVTDKFFGGFREMGAGVSQRALTPSYATEEVKYLAEGGRSADVGLSAQFVGKGAIPQYSPTPGSVTERFAFDEYGKVLRAGEPFEPAYGREGIPYNSKMGAGEYIYAGEYQYKTGERVSRYVEKNVGSYADFGQGGMAFRKEVVVRGGAGPGGYYATTSRPSSAQVTESTYTDQQSAVMRQVAAMGVRPASPTFNFGAAMNVAKYVNRGGESAVSSIERGDIFGNISKGFDNIFGMTGFGEMGKSAGQSALGLPEVKYTALGTRASNVGLSAQFVGKGAIPQYSPIPGSVTERFAFDEYGKVLGQGGKFEPAYSNAGIPYNPKMGAGEYIYAGEYQYKTGERVSRYVEKNVGSYVDFGQGGMAFKREVVIRGGGSPGAYYATAQQVEVPSGSAVKGTSGFDIFGAVRGAVDFGYNLPSYAVSRGNEMFAQIPVLSQVNLAGREAGIGMEISQKNEYLFAKTKGYEESGIIRGGVFTGTQEQYADLVATQNRVGVLQAERENIQRTLTGNVNQATLFTKPVYDAAHAGSEFWAKTVVGGKDERGQWSGIWGMNVGKKLDSSVGVGIEKYLNDNRGNIDAMGMIPGIGMPFKMLASENPLILNTPSKLSEASTALVGVPGQMFEFGGMAVVGGETLLRNPVAIPALAMSGLMMQGQGIEEGMRTRPTGFFYEQLGMIAVSEVAIRGAQRASPIGGGALKVLPYEKSGPATTYYAAYTKMPFAAEGGVPRFMAGVAKTGGGLSAKFASPSFDVKIIAQNPVVMGRVPFFVPKSSEMGFFGVRAPIATEANPMFGIGYTRVPGSRPSPFIGSPASKFSSLTERGWKFGHLFPFEFEKGFTPGLTSAERSVLPSSVMRSREYGIMQDVMSAQDFLKGKSEISQKRPYDYKHADITQQAWNEFLNVLQRPEYRNDVIVGGSTVTEPFVESGKFRPLKAMADTDLFVRDTSFEKLANDINSGMSSQQGNIFMEIDRSRATPSFVVGAIVRGERVGIIEAHTFSAFPDVMKQTTQLSLKGGGTLTAVAPEYTLRSKLAGSMFALRYSREGGTEFAFKRLKDFPDVISLTREASGTYPATSDMFKRLSDDYTKMISSNRAGIDIKDVAAARFAKPEWVAANRGVTLESLTKEMTADLRGYQSAVKGFGNAPFGVSRPAIETTSRFGVSFFSPEIKYTPAIKYQLFTGSPGKILKDTSFRISPSMETKDGPWSNIQHAVFDKYLIERLPDKEAAVVRATSPAVRAAYSNLFTPVQRAPFGDLPTTSASRATMGKVVKGLEQFGPDFIEGGSRAQNVWLGKAGPYESKFGSDFDTYTKNAIMTNEAFRSIVGLVKGEFPKVETMRGTHPGTNPDIAKTQASVTTIAGEEFFHIKPIEKYGYMTELPPVKVAAINDASAYVIDARLLFKRSTAGMFSGLIQRSGEGPRLVLDRPKDIVPARGLARSFAETLYKPPIFDVGGIFTRAKVSRAVTLERYSDAILDYSRSLPKDQRNVVTGMMSEAKMDPLKGVDRFPQPSIDIVTGRGWLDRPVHGWNEEAVFAPGRRRMTGSVPAERMFESDVRAIRVKEESYPQSIRQTRGSQEVAMVVASRRVMEYPVALSRSSSTYPLAAFNYSAGSAKAAPMLFATVADYSRSRIVSEVLSGYPGFATTKQSRYPVSQFTQRYPTTTPSVRRSAYPVTQPSRNVYPFSATSRAAYPTSVVSRATYPTGTTPQFYPTTTTRGGGRERNAFFGYTPLTSLTTYVYPGMEKEIRRKKKKARKSEEWYILNPVALFESVFGYNVREVWPGQFPLMSSHLKLQRPRKKPRLIGPYQSGPGPW